MGLRAGVLCLLVMTLTGLAAAAPEIGDTCYVSSRRLPLHQSPNGYSEVLCLLPFGTPATVTSVVVPVAAPVPNESAKGKGKGKGAKAQTPPAAWLKVQAAGEDGSLKEGYVPARCMVTERILRRQDPDRALTKVQNRKSDGAGKGFSETEEGDLQALKGMGGQAQASGAGGDHAGMDALLAAPAEYDPKDAYAEFRQQGGLAEYRPAK